MPDPMKAPLDGEALEAAKRAARAAWVSDTPPYDWLAIAAATVTAYLDRFDLLACWRVDRRQLEASVMAAVERAEAAESRLAALPAPPGDLVGADDRNPECVAAWPECFSGGYDPRCCRFPKSCSCMSQHYAALASAERPENEEG